MRLEEIGEFEGWTYRKIDGITVYNRVVVLTGSTKAVKLPFSKGIKLNRIEQWFDSTNARSFNTRLYSGIRTDAYVGLDTQSGHISTSRLVQFGDEFKYPSATKLEINYSSYTADDEVAIQVQVEDL